MRRLGAARRPALTIRYPGGPTVQLLAGGPATVLPDGRAVTLTADDLHDAGARLVAYGLATHTGRHEVTARLPRAQLLTALAARATASSHRP